MRTWDCRWWWCDLIWLSEANSAEEDCLALEKEFKESDLEEESKEERL